MRKSVKNGPLPDTDAPAQGGDEVDALTLRAACRHCGGRPDRSDRGREVLRPGGAAPTSDDEANLNDAWLVERGETPHMRPSPFWFSGTNAN